MKIGDFRIGVLGGGVSTERDISLNSSHEACGALVKKGLDVVSIDILTKKKNQLKEIISSSNIGLAFIALHGEFGEDGRIQEILEELGIAYTGSGPKASALAMNKAHSKMIFKAKGILTPNFTVLSKEEDIPTKSKYPLVVKPWSSGSSIGVSIVRGQGNLRDAFDLAFSHSSDVILEDYIEGRELTVGILEEESLAVVEIIPKKGYFDFEAKYNHGASDFIAPAQLSNEVEREVRSVGLAAHRILGCQHFSRADIRLSKDNLPFVLEVNSIPGLTLNSLLPLSARVCGIDFNELIFKMVELALSRAIKPRPKGRRWKQVQDSAPQGAVRGKL